MEAGSDAQRPGALLTPTFLLVTLAALGAFVSIGALLPTLPRYADGPLGAGGVGIGLAAGASSITALVCQPLAGRAGDRLGRRVLLLGGTGLMAATTATYVLIDALPLLVGMRLLTGVGEALFFVGAATIVNDLAPGERRGQAFSYFTLAAYGGLAIGPLLGDIVLAGDRYDAVWLAAAASALAAFLIGLLVPETMPAHDGPKPGGRFVYGPALPPGLVLLAALFGFGGFNAFIALYALELGVERTGLVFATFAVIVLLVRSVGARIPDVLGPRRAAQVALVCLSLGMATIAGWRTVAGLFLGTAIFSVGQSLAFPALMALAVGNAPPAARSSAVGTISAFVDLAIALGAVTLGAVVGIAGYRGAFLTASAVSAGGLLLLARLRTPSP
ncbi:MAG: MFS transporter [Gaiellaceae bacterium]